MRGRVVLVLGALFLFGAIEFLVPADQSKVYYVCNCKDDCKCNFVANKPGKCSCGTALTAMHVLAIEKGSGIFCRCGADCTCERSKSDPSKCGCGKSVKTVSLKGKYVCNCGPNCNCGTISDKPGKCHCGKDLRMSVRSKKFAWFLAAACTAVFFISLLNGQQVRRDLPATPLANTPIAIRGGEIGEILRKWYSEGTAAGNLGDYYDNRDGGHSHLNLAPYPQLQQVEYTEEQIKTKQNWGMQKKILPFVVFGNSSTSAAPNRGGSNVMAYYTNPRGLAFLFTQYVRNNLYIYPEHRDHDPGHNGVGGYGDLFPTNTPFLIASQGSSGSDQPFMRALPYVLAAFRPEVKKKLVQTGMLIPTVQMILRFTSKKLSGSKDYLTGNAHPTVFEGRDLDAQGMVEMAHKINLSEIPPIALIKPVQEDVPTSGMDYFEPESTEKLADTPVVIARIFRGVNHLRKIVVSAEDSKDLNGRPLKFYWAVLRGDSRRIKIEYRSPSRSVAEITVPYQERSPISEGAALESNRIDIGVFVHNGAYYSPPAFITFYTLDNEARTYRSDGRPLEIAYGVGTTTMSIADWSAFFDALTSHSDSWPSAFLRRHFSPTEISALTRSAEEYRKIHEKLLAAQEMKEKADTAQKMAGDDANAKKQSAADSVAARKAVREAQNSESQLLDEKIPSLNLSTAELVGKALQALMQDPNLWADNSEAIKRLCDSATGERLEKFGQIQKLLVLFGVAENPDGVSFRLTPLKKGNSRLEERLTRYEKGMVERLNAITLSQIIFPGIVDGEWRENYVDYRIAAAKDWRDVYHYAPDGTPVGWERFQTDGRMEFNADGLLVLERDSRGRCIRARVVRYELEPQKRNAKGRIIGSWQRRVKMIQTDTLQDYEYDGLDDWKGHLSGRKAG
jgi:hypothetical protein